MQTVPRRVVAPLTPLKMLTMLTLTLISGCAAQQIAPNAQFAPVLPVLAAQPREANGSLFVDGRSENFFGRQRDYRVGDVVTVLLDERTQSLRTQNTTVKRTATNDAFPSIQNKLADSLGRSGLPLGGGVGKAVGMIKADGAVIGSDGGGNSGQQNALTGSIAVTVIEVMSNGNPVVRGEKQVTLSEGSEVIQVFGVVRTEDIASNGTVTSKRLANAQITYRGTGDLASSAKPGWGTNLLNNLWPF